MEDLEIMLYSKKYVSDITEGKNKRKYTISLIYI